jgi:hypothetical protein
VDFEEDNDGGGGGLDKVKAFVRKHPVAVFGIGGGIILGLFLLTRGGKKQSGSSAGLQMQPPSWWLGQSSGSGSSIIPQPAVKPKPTPGPIGLPMCPANYRWDGSKCVPLGEPMPMPYIEPPGPTPQPQPDPIEYYPGKLPMPTPNPWNWKRDPPGPFDCAPGYYYNGTSCVPIQGSTPDFVPSLGTMAAEQEDATYKGIMESMRVLS